mgnify:CR=1 FL=1|tara:strand:+ start:1767 stop:1994 length:228 start_codon:yes stop_codon:yes gene_type:complete
MSEVPTQVEVDKIHPLALEDFNRLLEESGKSELMFKMSHEGMQFMGQYQMMKEHAESEGFTMPELFGDGTKITLS